MNLLPFLLLFLSVSAQAQEEAAVEAVNILANLGGVGAFAWLVYRQTGNFFVMIREDLNSHNRAQTEILNSIREMLSTNLQASVNAQEKNGQVLAVLCDRVLRPGNRISHTDHGERE